MVIYLELQLFRLFIASALIGQGISYRGIYLYHCIFLFTIIFLLVRKRINIEQIKRIFKRHYPFLIILLIAIVHFLKSEEEIKPLARLAIGLSVLILPLFFKIKNKLNVMYRTIFYTYIASILISLLEVFTTFRWPWSPISKFKFYLYSGSFIKNKYPLGYESYPTSFYWHPNNLAIINMISLPLIIRSNVIDLKWKVVLSLVNIFLMITAGAKGILIISILYIGIEGTYYFFKEKLNIKQIFILIATLALSVSFFVGTLNNDQKNELQSSVNVVTKYAINLPKVIQYGFSDRSFNVAEEFDGGTSERMMFMIGALREFRKAPLTGVGFKKLSKSDFVNGTKTYHLKSIHNHWLEVLTSLGILGLLSYLSWNIIAIKDLIRIKNKELLIALVIFSISVPVMSSAYYFLPMWLLYSVIAVANTSKKEVLPDSQQP